MVSASTRSCSSSLQDAASEACALTVIALIPRDADDVLQMLAIALLVDRESSSNGSRQAGNHALGPEIREPRHRQILPRVRLLGAPPATPATVSGT